MKFASGGVEVPWHPQFLADQLTLSQPKGHIMPTKWYWHPRIFRPSFGPGKRTLNVSLQFEFRIKFCKLFLIVKLSYKGAFFWIFNDTKKNIRVWGQKEGAKIVVMISSYWDQENYKGGNPKSEAREGSEE